jgi:membrane protein
VISQLPGWLRDRIWGPAQGGTPHWKKRVLHAARLILVLIRDLAGEQLTLRAMSLVYTTLLSIVPLLALSFSVLKAFGVYNQLEPALRRFLTPLGPQGDEMTAKIIGFIENIDVGVLGSVGLALLIYTAVSLVQKLEEAFNHIWHVARPRSLAERFSHYLSVLLLGPLLVFAALGITASVLHVAVVQRLLAVAPLGHLFHVAGRVLPYVLVIGAFTFIYVFIPNTRVRLQAALLGGVTGGTLWQTAGRAFALFVTHATSYSTIYSSFAILLLSMIWLYLSWLILLFGASLAFYWQHPQYLVAEAGEPRLSNRMRERVSLAVMSLVAAHHRRGGAPWTAERLSGVLNVPMHAVAPVLDALEAGGVLVRTAGDPPGYLPSRSLSAVSVAEVLRTVRSASEEGALQPSGLPLPPVIEAVLERLDRNLEAGLEGLTLEGLAADEQDATSSPGAGRGARL